jgi:hypothetical protein
MRQVQIAKVSRPNQRYDDAPLPLDPRDPDVVRAKQLLSTGHPSSTRSRPSREAAS